MFKILIRVWIATFKYNKTQIIKTIHSPVFCLCLFYDPPTKSHFYNLIKFARNNDLRLKIGRGLDFIFFYFSFSPVASLSHSVSATLKQFLTSLLICPCQVFHASTTGKSHYQSLFLYLPVKNVHLWLLA